MKDLIGWVSSIVLLVTIVSQVSKQWTERSGRESSRWLFIGQTAASLGFTAYSVLVENWVFTVTNALLLLSGLVGWGMNSFFRGRAPSSPPGDGASRHLDSKAGAS